ncbi:cobalt-precorrin-7 (C(5))-methyltransferase [Methanogenium organophilum]|uniref:Cobalt-precorrin-7 (C(5))-methyltransferase n=1 Tax=Methanogenium organophilum TaxID=2199 RepID=A0A9X9S587_METOG|nr:cobalt-precorrin-7 (C(5))-methyltransferase [Methanogenium organophilum]WAI01732.1 cobalt-precorrin-7 (C(5))-methyltransferase [Methanogenium organophilum]
MKVVGVGCGPGMLTEAAIAAIRDAKEIYGSERAIERAAGQIPACCSVHVITDYKALRDLPETAVVLSTGDPMLAGLGYLGGDVISGISSYQYACAKLHIPLTKTAIVNAHAKDHEQAILDIIFEIRRGRTAFVIADPAFVPSIPAEALKAHSLQCRIAICERLGYPDERIAIGDTDTPPVPGSDLFVLMAGDF